MSKKKEINLKTPAAVESGDVNISYNNVLVGSLSDSGTAVLKTEMTICEHDIELEYTKSAGGIGNILNITNNGINSVYVAGEGFYFNGRIEPAVTISTNDNKTGYILSIKDHNTYVITFSITVLEDLLNVTVNNAPLSFTPTSKGGVYAFTDENASNPINGNTYNVVISDKE